VVNVQQCPQCLVFYSRVKSPYIEVLPVDPTAKKPVQMDSVARLEPDPLQRRTGAVLAIAVHTGSFPFVAAGTADGCVSVWRCPFLSRLGSFHSSDGVVTFLSGELGGKDPVVAVAFHPTLPLLAGADASGHVIIWRLGGQRTGKTTLVCEYVPPRCVLCLGACIRVRCQAVIECMCVCVCVQSPGRQRAVGPHRGAVLPPGAAAHVRAVVPPHTRVHERLRVGGLWRVGRRRRRGGGRRCRADAAC
jgi:hypothetical protein